MNVAGRRRGEIADVSVPYDEIREVMAVCREAGVEEVALMTTRRVRH